MPEALKCPRCGAILPGEGWEGLCPKCIVRVSIETPADPKDSALRVPSSAFQKVRYFGDYELLEEIARGGMGVVYKARQRSLNRLVAVKMIVSGEYASSEFVRRFRAEAEAAANLSHPNIVAIYEVGEHEGQQYFSMEYVDGENLAAWSARCRNRNAGWCRQAAEIVESVAEAVHFAHQHGILHRDLKPSNILIDRFEHPRITDFGLAKRLSGDSDLTLTGQVLGSPNYMPPEQAEGKRRQATIASDIYSLGAILYHLLTGRPPFAAESVTETLQKLLQTEPASLRQLNPNVSKDLETICLKCLEKDPRRRYASAKDLADELGHFLRDEPIVARPIGPAGRFGRWCRRNPVMASFAAATTILLITVAIGSPIAAFHINRERKRAVQKEEEATDRLWESYLAQAQARRWSGRVGQRFESLDALRKAAAIHPTRQLRNEAIACMALPDLRIARQWEKPSASTFWLFDPSLEHYAKMYSSQNMIGVYRVADDAEVMRASGFKPPELDIRFSPNGQYLAVACGTELPQLRVWDLKRRQLVLAPSEFHYRCMDFSADNRALVIGTRLGGPIVLYDLISGTLLKTLKQSFLPWSIALHPDGGKLAISSDQSHTVEIRDLDTGQVIQPLVHPRGVKRVCWHPRGNFLAAACMDNNVYVWDITTGKVRSIFKGHEAPVTNVYLDSAGDFLASDSWDSTFRIWDFWTGRQLLSLPGTLARFSRDGHWITGSSDEGKPTIWELARGQESWAFYGGLEARTGPVDAVFGPDDRLLASAHSDGVRLWDATDLREIAHFGNEGYHAVAFDGETLLAGGQDGFMRWPLRLPLSQQSNFVSIDAAIATGPSLDVGTFALSTQSRTIAVVNHSLRVFDYPKFEERYQLRKPERCWAVALSGDGKWMAAAPFARDDVLVYNLTERGPRAEATFGRKRTCIVYA